VIGRGYAVISAALGIAAFIIIGNVAIPVAVAIVALALNIRQRLTGHDLTRTSWDFAWQVVLVLGGLALYTFGRVAAESDIGSAYANTDRVIDLERSLHLYFEDDLQRWIMGYETLTRLENWTYSFAFLAITGAVLVWLWAVDGPNYRLLRNSLGISALLAIPTIALWPVAPPRLVPESGLVDSIALFGREHAFSNEYAAIPSLHVGWMAAVGFVMGRSIGGKAGALVAILLGPLMLVTVIATGNHFWWDGVIGVAYTLGPAVALVWIESGSAQRASGRIRQAGAAAVQATALTWNTLGENRRALFSFLSLGGLLAYLTIAQRLTPGFTDFWGYLVGQVFVFLVLLVAAEVVFARQGGLSWITHVIAVSCAYADVLGTDGNLYAAIDEYDKVTHFAGVAALTAGVYDCLRCMHARGWLRWTAGDRALLSISVGVAIGIGWEVYELLGDRVFGTARVNSRWDTGNDIVSDSLGAFVFALLLLWTEIKQVRAAEEATEWDILSEPADLGQPAQKH
jgi:hypothetical protein